MSWPDRSSTSGMFHSSPTQPARWSMAASTNAERCGLSSAPIPSAFRPSSMVTGPLSPVRPDPDRSEEATMDTHSEYDVIVIGSGVAGALTAWKLSQLGPYRILILEAGDNGISAGQRLQFHHMMDTQGSRGDPYAPYMDLESRKYAPAAEKSQRELDDQKNDSNNYYDSLAESTSKTHDPFKASYNRMVGGSTWSWRGNTPRFLPGDFRLRSEFGVGWDWPLDYNELEPWYCQAEWELGVSG